MVWKRGERVGCGNPVSPGRGECEEAVSDGEMGNCKHILNKNCIQILLQDSPSLPG